MTEHEIGLLMGENKAFIERLAWYSVGVVNLLADIDHQNKTMADVLGTGTACTWNGHSLILTAEHVVAERRNLIVSLFFYASQTPLTGKERASRRRWYREYLCLLKGLSGAGNTTWRLSFFVPTIWLPSACSSVTFRNSSQRVERSNVKGPSFFSATRQIEYLPSQRPRPRMPKLVITRSDRPYSQGQSQTLRRRHCHPNTTRSAMC